MTIKIFFAPGAWRFGGAVGRAAMMLLVTMLTTMTTMTAWAQTEIEGLTYNATDGCYDIGTLTELQAFITYANSVSDGTQCEGMTFRLTADIGNSESPVGSIYPVLQFKGTFDGNFHAITGMVITEGLQTGDRATSATAFFCRCNGGNVKNLTLTDVTVDATGCAKKENVGAIMGRGHCKIENCHVTGSLKGASSIGGVAGLFDVSGQVDYNSFSISGCTFSGTITAGDGIDVGGIVGETYFPVTNCTVTNAVISCEAFVGGIAGACHRASVELPEKLITGCKVANVSITCTSSHADYKRCVGGIVGRCGAKTRNYDAPTTENCIYEYGDDNVKGVGGYQDNGDQYGTDAGCTRVYAVHCGEGVTATYASGTTVSIGDVTCYESGTTFTLAHGDVPEGYTGFLGYYVTDGSGNNVKSTALSGTTLTLPASDVTVKALWFGDDHLAVDGTVYTIKTATGWGMFCDLLGDGTSFTGKTVKLDDDISVTTMASTSTNKFTGTFDGQGYKLTVSYGTEESPINEQYAAPFRYVDGATIQNLIVDGTIISNTSRAAGVIGETGSTTSHITNCVSSSTIRGGSYTGGFSIGGNVEIESCVFNGKINGSDKSGGFVGYSNSKLVITNCLFAPQSGSSISGGTFYYNGGGEITPTNSYYSEALGTAQGEEGILLYDGGVPATANVGVISRCATKQYDVTLQGRTLYKDGAWNTLCLPFDVDDFSGTPLEGATVMELDVTGTYSGHKTGLDGTTLYLYFKDATSIVAGKPYLVKWDVDTEGTEGTEDTELKDPVFEGVTVSNAENDVTFTGGAFRGTYSPVTLTANDRSVLYLGAGNKLYWPSKDRTIGACRAYFQMSDGQEARQFVLNFGGDATGVRLIDNGELIIDNGAGANGQWSMVNGQWYDLSGRKISVPSDSSVPSVLPKGVYIHGGRKVVVK